MNNEPIQCISDRKQMLAILTQSKEKGTTVGINASVLGGGIYVSAVEDLILEEDIIIVLKSYDITGYVLEINRVKLSEIRIVYPFTAAFENPYLKNFNRFNAA